MSRTFRAFFSFLLVAAASISPLTVVLASDPSLANMDPTYGLPIPKTRATEQAEPASWIWSSKLTADPTVYLRGLVTLDGPIKAGTVYVTGDDGFTLWVNGVKIDTGSAWQTIHKDDVRQYLHDGSNDVAIQGVNTGGPGGILAELLVNGKTVLQTDSHWKVFDGANPAPNWFSMSFDSFTWDNAVEEAPAGKGVWGANLDGWPASEIDAAYLAHIKKYPIGMTIVNGDVDGLNTSKMHISMTPASSSNTILRVDFGRELAGRIVLLATANTKVTINTGETIAELTTPEPALDNSGPFDRVVDTSDDGTPATTPYTAFRYAQFSFPPGQNIDITGLYCDDKYYPVTYKGSFNSSDPLLNKIWYEGAYTSHLCMQEQIWDAPKRDRGLWCGDMHVSGEVINDVFLDTFLMELSIKELRDIAQGGNPAGQMPANEINNLPGYTSAWFCELADFYRHSGDIAFVKSERQNIVTLLDYQKQDFDSDNLYTNPRKLWNFVDWAPDFVLDSDQSHMATDLFDIKGVREAVFLLRSVGDDTNADKYSAWADTLVSAAQRNYVDQKSQTFGGRLQPNVMAVYSGTATTAQVQAIYSQILQSGSAVWKPRPTFAGTDAEVMSPYYGNYVLIALGKTGHQQDGIDLIRRYWGDMVSRGQTTLWEKFDSSYPKDFSSLLPAMPYLSFCHGWSAGPTSYLSEYILGVHPTSGGFKTTDIVPFLGDLAWINGVVPTPTGNISVAARKAGKSEYLTVTVPAGIQARIGVNSPTITVNGKRARVSSPESGIYYFSAANPGVYRVVESPFWPI